MFRLRSFFWSRLLWQCITCKQIFDIDFSVKIPAASSDEILIKDTQRLHESSARQASLPARPSSLRPHTQCICFPLFRFNEWRDYSGRCWEQANFIPSLVIVHRKPLVQIKCMKFHCKGFRRVIPVKKTLRPALHFLLPFTKKTSLWLTIKTHYKANQDIDRCSNPICYSW